MKDFVKMTGAVMLGTLAASGAAVALLLNKKVLKKYMAYAVELSEEITEEMMEKHFED